MSGKRWTTEQRDALRRLWPQPKSSVEIARELGVTDKAVRRQAATLGLERRPSGGIQSFARRRPQSAPPVLSAPYKPKDVWAPLPDSRPVDIMGLTSTTCRWPLEGDLYCGAHTATTYCLAHNRIAYNAPPKAPGEVDGRLRRRA